MSIKMKSSAGILAGTAALLLAGCASNDKIVKDTKVDNTMNDDTLGRCHSVNNCKGTSACATASSACAGQNSCKGTGWISSSKSDCGEKGGKFTARK